MTCRICLEDGGELIQPCNCKGTAANVHPDCLIKWLNISGTTSCEICKFEYECEDVLVNKPCRETCHCRISSDPQLRLTTYSLGFAMICSILVYGWLFTESIETVFLSINIIQLFIITLCSYLIQDSLNALLAFTFFKTCSVLGFGVLASMGYGWLCLSYDASILAFTLMVLYIRILTAENLMLQRQIII
jgi:hypothetical protein